MQQSPSSGRTTTSRVKTLLLHVQSNHGRVEADAFLLKTKLDREYLEDETRPLPVELWHAALVAFASRWGRDAIPRTVRAVVHPENLGVWTRVLRGAPDAASAFEQLDQYGGDEVLTDVWQTAHVEPGRWRGRMVLRSDLLTERDGLCLLARTAELSAIPLLFGLRPGVVTVLPADVERTGAAHEFEVRWQTAPPRALVFGSAAGLVAGAAAASALADVDPLVALGLLGGIATLGATGGGFLLYDQRRRTQSRSQLIRIQTLERMAALRDARERGSKAFHSGTVVAGQYRLGEKLGSGASGAIWEAERLRDGKVVAIKLLRAAVAHDTVAADRLRREASALGLAWHPNVVEVYDEGHLPDGTSYLAMERLYGESLAKRLQGSQLIPPHELLPIALQVCDALGAVHAAGVVHRDLKPSNIFLSHPPTGPSEAFLPTSVSDLPTGERVKLLDFGIARVEWAEPRLTIMGAPLGTPGYMSPEQEQGVEIDGRSDLFALGTVLYECLTGEAPPARTSALWAVQTQVESAASGVRRASVSIPDVWQKLIERAMAPLPRDRFSDARAMREALLKLAEPIEKSGT